MKSLGFVALSGVALLQVAAAACCRSNQCLKAVVLAGEDGIADCSANAVITVTLSPSASTQTVTVVESGVATALFTETTTETISTETLLFTETTTITAATQTDVILESETVLVTATDVQLAAPVTSTSTNYQSFASVKARQTAAPLPEYASAVCANWDQYIKACSCAGVEISTVTVPGAAETVTVTANDAVTTTVSTLSSTQTDTISLTETVTATETTTAASTTTVLATSTPTVIVPITCLAKGLSFRASTPFSDGTTRWMNTIGQASVAWQTFASGSSLTSSTWVLDSNGYLELTGVIGTATSVLAAYVDLSKTAATVAVLMKAKTDVEAGVAAGTWARVKGCVSPTTNEVTLSGNGRSNILSCGNSMYLSTGDGSDYRSDCARLFPTGNQV